MFLCLSVITVLWFINHFMYLCAFTVNLSWVLCFAFWSSIACFKFDSIHYLCSFSRTLINENFKNVHTSLNEHLGCLFNTMEKRLIIFRHQPTVLCVNHRQLSVKRLKPSIWIWVEHETFNFSSRNFILSPFTEIIKCCFLYN